MHMRASWCMINDTKHLLLWRPNFPEFVIKKVGHLLLTSLVMMCIVYVYHVT